MADFPFTETIELRYFTDLWGTYLFEFENAIPAADPIVSVTVKAYIGSVKSSSTLSGFTDVSANIIDPGHAPQIQNDTQVLVWMQYPGATYKDEKVTLIFELTLNSGAKHPLFFPYIKVRGEA